jgi:hypothetical protein
MPSVELQVMKPQLGIIEEVERDERHTLVLGGTTHMEVALGSIEPKAVDCQRCL